MRVRIKAWRGAKTIGTKDKPLISLPLPTKHKTKSFLIGKKEDVIERKTDVAIAVQVSDFLNVQVRDYIENEKIDANLVVVTNSLDIQKLEELDNDKPEEWREVVLNFTEEIKNTQRIFGAVTFHLFLSAPSTLAVALGASLGRQRRGYIYHWDAQAQTYAKVLVLPRDIG